MKRLFFLLFFINILFADTQITLTQEESQFLKDNPKLKVANEMDWPPFDYYENANPKGLSIDFIKLVAKKAGFEIEFVNHKTWPELLEMFKNKEIDLMPVLFKNGERKKFTLYSSPYYKTKLGVFTREGSGINTIEELVGQKVGIQSSHGAIPMIKELVPSITLIENTSNDKLVQMLATKKLDAVIGNPLLVYFYIKENHANNIELKSYVDLKKDDNANTLLHIGVRDDWKTLHSIIEKALGAIRESEFRKIEEKWIGLKPAQSEQILLSQKEKLYLANKGVIKISNEMDYPPYDFAIGDKPEGYSIDLIKLVAKKLDLNIEFINGYTWSELLGLYEKREIDLMQSISRNAKREKDNLFSKPFKRYKTRFITREETEAITDIKQLFGKRVVMGKGWGMDGYITEKYPEIELIRVAGLEQMLEAVANNKADAAMSGEDSALYLMKKHGFSNLKITGWFEDFDKGQYRKFHFMAKKDSPELISIMNKGLDSLTLKDIEGLDEKWFGKSGNGNKEIYLTSEEKNYINQKKKFLMCIDPDWMPFDGLNEHKQHEGVGAEYISLFAARLGIEVERVPTENWAESLERVENRSCDFLSLAKETPNRKKYLDFTETILSVPYVIATKSNRLFIDNFRDIKDEKFAVIRGFAVAEDLKRDYPESEIVFVENIEEGLEKVADGEVYGYIDATAVIGYALSKYGIMDIKIAGKLPWNFDLSVATRNDEALLGKLFQKAVDSLNESEKDRIYHKWIAIKRETTVDYDLLWKIVGFALLVIGGTIYWNRRLNYAKQATEDALLKLEVAKKEIEEKNKKLLELSITDKLTGLYNRRKLDELIELEMDRSRRFNHIFALVIVDIDHFKDVNDEFGHQVGDTVLQEIANVLKMNLRSTDFIGRWGGEEFVMILPESDVDGALHLMEMMRRKIESNRFTKVEHKTATFGITIFKKNDTLQSVIERADLALYKGKNSGRNKCVVIQD